MGEISFLPPGISYTLVLSTAAYSIPHIPTVLVWRTVPRAVPTPRPNDGIGFPLQFGGRTHVSKVDLPYFESIVF